MKLLYLQKQRDVLPTKNLTCISVRRALDSTEVQMT